MSIVQPVPMQQLTIYVGEHDQWQHRSLYLAILDRVRGDGGAGATVLKGIAGYSAAGRVIHTAGLVDIVPNLPLVILVVDEAPRITALLPILEEMIADHGGLITVTDLAGYRYHHTPRPAIGARTVGAIMETDVTTVPPDLPVADLLPLLLHKFYKALPVIDAERHVLGMVTDSDLLQSTGVGARVNVLEAIQDLGGAGFENLVASVRVDGKTARDIMGVRPDAVIGPEASVADAARMMVRLRVKRLPVVDQERRLLGIVSRLDVLKAASNVATPGSGAAISPPPTGAHTVREVMLTDVPTVTADTSIEKVVEVLARSGRIRRVIVTESEADPRVVGIITDADLVQRVAAPERPGLVGMLLEGFQLIGASLGPPVPLARGGTGTAREVMTSPVVTAPATLPPTEAINLMVARGVKALPIVDSRGALIGLVNRARLLQALIGPAADE